MSEGFWKRGQKGVAGWGIFTSGAYVCILAQLIHDDDEDDDDN